MQLPQGTAIGLPDGYPCILPQLLDADTPLPRRRICGSESKYMSSHLLRPSAIAPPIAHRSHVARRMRLPVLISLPVAHTLSAVRCNAGAVIGVKFPNLLFPTPEDTNKNDACTKRRRRFLFTVHFPALSRRALIFSLLNMQNAVISRIRRSKAGDQFSI